MGDTLNIKAEAKNKTLKTEQKVLAALATMLAAEEKISFYAVAKKAQVSPNFLYTHLNLRTQIMELRKQTELKLNYDKQSLLTINTFTLELEKADLQARLAQMEQQIQELQQENKRLKKCLDILCQNEIKESTPASTPNITAPF